MVGRFTTAISSLLIALSGAALADEPGPQPGCLLSPAKLSDDAVRSFRQRPEDLLERHPSAGPAMSAEVRRLAGSDMSVIEFLIGLTKDASSAQTVALGVGLAQAAAICEVSRPDLQQQIKRAVAEAKNAVLAAAFAVGASSFDAVDFTRFPSIEAADDGNGIQNGPPPVESGDPDHQRVPGGPSHFSNRRPPVLGYGGATATSGKSVSPAR